MLNKQEKLKSDILYFLEDAEKQVDQIEVSAVIEIGFSVDVRLGDVETFEQHHKNSLNVTVYHQQRTGNVSTSNLSLKSIKQVFHKASVMSKFSQEDACTGLANVDEMAIDYQDLKLFYPWIITKREAINLAIECETIAKNQDSRIQSKRVNVSTYSIFKIYANSHGFIGYYPSTLHSVSCELIAKQNRLMQCGYDYTIARNPKKLLSTEIIAKKTVEKTISRLGARRLSTRQSPVIFHALVASSLIRFLIAAINGSNLYRGASFLQNQLHQQIFPEFITIYQNPHLPSEIGSMPFDENGVKTQKINYIENGILTNYVLGTYSARKLGMKSTGNSGGVYNVFITNSNKNLNDLLQQMQHGLLLTELMGQSVDLTTGNYSQGAFGFWVEKGEIQYPVEEITVASNLKDMFKRIQYIGNDIDSRSNIKTGSILIENMIIAGK